MKLSKEIKNGLLIFLGISSLFFVMKLIGLEKIDSLRALNVFKVYYGMMKTLQANKDQKVFDFGENIFSIFKTALIGITLSIIGLYLYIYINGGQEYLSHISKGYFTKANPNVIEYCFGLYSEGIVSAVILTFICMQFWKPKPSDKI